MPKRKNLILLFFGLFCFRLFFGLCQSKLWEVDQIQVYLVGLKCYTTGTWPYFGPDVNGAENQTFQSQIPGALAGLVIALPLRLLPIPESPFILLNFLSTLGAALLAWYIKERLPKLSFAWLFLWICVAPWSLHEATHIINPAFTFLPSVLFFIGFMESLPWFRMGLVPIRWANAAMGFALFWIMQFHFSYVYLLLLTAFSLLVQLARTRKAGPLLSFSLGALPTLALILPTYFQYGFARNNVASGFTVPFNGYNVGEFWTLLARFLSLACFELPRFIGTGTAERIAFLKAHAWILAPGALLWVIGLVQPFLLSAAWFMEVHRISRKIFWAGVLALCLLLGLSTGARAVELLIMTPVLLGVFFGLGHWYDRSKWKPIGPHWRELTLLLSFVFAMVYASFWFTVKLPLSHIYFVFFPLIMTFSCHFWARFAGNANWRLAAKVFLVVALFFQIGFALAVAPVDSLYVKREPVAKAIQEKDYHLMGERRPGSLY